MVDQFCRYKVAFDKENAIKISGVAQKEYQQYMIAAQNILNLRYIESNSFI